MARRTLQLQTAFEPPRTATEVLRGAYQLVLPVTRIERSAAEAPSDPVEAQTRPRRLGR